VPAKITPIDWKEVTKSNKGVRTNDRQTCENVIAKDGDSVIISEDLINMHELYSQIQSRLLCRK
jgi:hypothetical protein